MRIMMRYVTRVEEKRRGRGEQSGRGEKGREERRDVKGEGGGEG